MNGRRTDTLLAGLSGVVPACVAASHVGRVPDAAHDAGVARVLGFDTQAWRALDVAVGWLLAILPAGTRASRAALGGALVAGLTGAALYLLARSLLERCADARRLRFFVAAIAAVTPIVSAPWQIESAAVGGSVTGALLAIAPLALLASGATWAPVAFTLGLAAGHEPFVGACAFASTVACVASSPELRASATRAWREQGLWLMVAALAGLAPLAIALVRVRSAGVPLAPVLAANWAGERGLSHVGAPWAFVSTEVGFVLVVLAAGGFALAMLVPPARPLATSLVVVVLTGFGSAWLGAPLGPTRFGAPVLAAFAATSVLAGVSMQALVRAVATAKIPLARASAAMIVVLELALPADVADEGLVRAVPRSSGAAAAWDEAAWGSLPPRAVVIVTDPAVYGRTLAAQATGTLRDEVTIVPTFLHDRRVWRTLAADPALVPLWRDLELVGVPGEASLSSLASARPLFLAYEPAWGKGLGKHLVPATLFDRFEPEPRGASDRRRGLEAFAPICDRLARAIAGDPELTNAAAILLRARARLATDLSNDTDLAAKTDADLRIFAPRE